MAKINHQKLNYQRSSSYKIREQDFSTRSTKWLEKTSLRATNKQVDLMRRLGIPHDHRTTKQRAFELIAKKLGKN